MRTLFLICLTCWVSVSQSQEESMMIRALQEQAIANANRYANEVQHIAQSNLRQESIKEHLQKVGHVLVFLSFSMPEQSLEGWLKQCKQQGATPVIRGLIHNSFKDTLKRVSVLSEKTGMGVQIDPTLFHIFSVTQVPAVVAIKSYHYCPKKARCKEVSFNKIYGDVTLEYALQKMKGL